MHTEKHNEQRKQVFPSMFFGSHQGSQQITDKIQPRSSQQRIEEWQPHQRQ